MLDSAETRTGLLYALGAYGLWGLIAVYFKAVGHIGPGEILAHRVVWSVMFCAVLLSWAGRWGEFGALIGSRRAWGVLSVSAVLVAVNWLLFIVAVVTGRIVEASLGYFLNPLVSIVLGMVFFGERLRALQWVAVGFAVAGVGFLTVREGLPWIAVTLALTFGSYGLIRKRARPGPLAGLMFETSLLSPIAIGYLAWLQLGTDPGTVFVGGGWDDRGLLVAAGLVTSLPLLWFAAGAKRLPLSMMGFLQFLTPTMQFATGLLYGESFDADRAVAFGLIWVGVGVFVWSAVRSRRDSRRVPGWRGKRLP